ncbi:MAG TPA: YkgJ family cysteine cluster protein [Smithellaceae bacterium]|nr:YkgJ family cysteine cluster protein [Smithellaceae bacterium]HOR62651.1 YkgJ family cysteine cluster protein [Smithellaceae bacterium]HPL32356.1 YkgJ family cysteine cluster protein [Smithellaceae bacterium]HQN67908.1 YkgJ family cysteine cluster protein [Smithellaceae bacterium]
MKNTKPMECLRCGRCCLADFTAYATEEDIRRWKAEGRDDILEVLERGQAFWEGDRLMSRESGTPLAGCRFFAFDGERYFCAIHETRPAVCRLYEPGSSEICPQHSRLGKGNPRKRIRG